MPNKTKHTLTPKLRFPKFRYKPGWEEKEVGDIFDVTRGQVLSMNLVQKEQTSEFPYPVYSSQTKKNGLTGYYSDFLYENAITWTTDGANAGEVSYRPEKFYCTNVCGVLLNSKGYANTCIASLINAVSKKYVSYVGNPKLMNGVMATITIPVPEITEQHKIAACLSSLDALIAAEGCKLEALRAHKKGLMQQLFPRPGERIPRLRFPEFRKAGEWKRDALGEIATILKGKGISKSDIIDDGKTPCIRYGELYTTYGEIIEKVISRTNLPASDLVLSQAGDVIIPASGETKEDIATCACVADDGVALGSDLNIIRSLADGRFFSYYLNGSRRRELAKVAQGDTVAHLYPTQLSRLEVYIPEAKDEQQRIADCLFSLDDLLTAQTRKINALNIHKKGLMQQLFPSPEEAQA